MALALRPLLIPGEMSSYVAPLSPPGLPDELDRVEEVWR